MAPGGSRPPSERTSEAAILDALAELQEGLRQLRETPATIQLRTSWWDQIDPVFERPVYHQSTVNLYQEGGNILQLRYALTTDGIEFTLLAHGHWIVWQRKLFYRRERMPKI